MKYRANLITDGLSEIEIDGVSIFIGGQRIISIIPQGSLRRELSCINMAIEAYYSAYASITGKIPEDRAVRRGVVRYSFLQILKLIAGK